MPHVVPPTAHRPPPADPHTRNSYGCNAAMWAAQGGAPLDLCRYMHAELAVDFTRVNANGQGCLHKAAQRGQQDMCEWLLAPPSSVSAAGEDDNGRAHKPFAPRPAPFFSAPPFFGDNIVSTHTRTRTHTLALTHTLTLSLTLNLTPAHIPGYGGVGLTSIEHFAPNQHENSTPSQLAKVRDVTHYARHLPPSPLLTTSLDHACVFRLCHSLALP